MPTPPVTWTPDAEGALQRIKGKLFATTTETTAVLGWDKAGRTVRKAIEAGEIPAVKAGATYRVPTAWLLRMAALGTETEKTG